MTLFNLFFKKIKNNPSAPAVSWHDGQKSITLTNQELWIELKKVVSYFLSLNIKPGEKVGILAHTSGYWHLADLGIMAVGGTTVPIYPTASLDEIKFIIDDSQMSTIIVEDLFGLEKIQEFSNDLKLISLKESNHDNYFLNYRNHSPLPDHDIIDLINGNVDKYPASIIYTSGTTANPKGVVTEHIAISSVLEGIAKQMKGKVSSGDTSLISLPLSHVLGRCDSYLHLCLPIHSFFGESPKTFMTDLKNSKPSYLITVPRIIDKIKERIEASVRRKGYLTRKLFSTNYSLVKSYFKKIDSGQSPTQLETQLFIKSQKYFFSKIRAQISPELKFLVSGGAKLGTETYCFFRNIGIPILEGYGLTETFGPAFLNSKFNGPPGHVGFPLLGVQMKFGDDGEILLKGESVFRQYYRIKSEQFFDGDGYFRTGDIGQWSVVDGLKITDRKKDIIVTNGGKNIAPAKIEALMNNCPHISHFMLVGDQRKYLTGLVVINKEAFADLMESGKLSPDIEHDEMSQNTVIINVISTEIGKVNEKLASYEKIKQFYIIPVSIGPGSIYLSSSLKLKKDKLFNKYMKEIDAMY